ncbi:hypothetical protein J132_02329 [Termitomyces sp. J132]|nr:hypothetical protein J132_02329 [Termitomyces sp. J132]
MSFSETAKYALFELNGGYMLSMIREIQSDSVIPRGIKQFAHQALENLAVAHNAIIEVCVFQTCTANLCCRPDSELEKGALVHLLTKNCNLLQGRAKKLCPKWVGPYKILEAYNETSNYTSEFPMALQEHKIHPKFHVLLLQLYKASNNVLFPNRATLELYDFGMPDN